jgi:hypothetical protein
VRIFVLFLCCMGAAAAQEWTVRIVNVIPRAGRTEEGIKTKLRIDANTLVCDSRKKQTCDIPLWSITGLSHDTQARNRAAAYGDSPGSCDGMGCAANLAILALLAPFHVRWEYVRIQWRDNGEPRTTYLRFRSADFSSFEREVAARAQLTFESLTIQREERLQLIERRKSEALPVRLDRATFIRNEPVRGGLYQVLIVETAPDAGDLYLFRGKRVNPKKPTLVVPISIMTGAENVQTSEPAYSQRKRWKNLESIRMPGRTVRIMP